MGEQLEGAACSACLCDVLVVFCHSNTDFLAKNVIKTLLGMSTELCCIKGINQNGLLVDICFIWTTFVCRFPEVFACISHLCVLHLDACDSLKLWHLSTEVIMKHPRPTAVPQQWSYVEEMNLSGRTHVYHNIYVLDPIIHMAVFGCVYPVFLEHDLPCVAMELIFEEWE